MAVVKIVRRVRFPASAIWPVISDVVGFGEMAPDRVRCEVIEGEGVGLRRRSTDARNNQWVEVCTAWDEGRGYTMAIEADDYPYSLAALTTRLEFVEDAGASALVLHYEFRPAWGMLGHLMNGAWQRRLEAAGNALLDEVIRRVRDRVWMYTISVENILSDKGREVATIRPTTTILETAMLLEEKKIGAVPVLSEEGEIAGIVSERDIVRALPGSGADIMQQPVSGIMTRRVILCAPQDDMVSVMACMTGKRIRHLPVVDGDRLVGIISIGDVVKARMEDMEAESESMREYIASREWREQYMHGAAGSANPFAAP